MPLKEIIKGKTQVPPRIMVYGTEGIGKSTFASQAPKPIFIQTEDGLNEIVCEKFPLATSMEDVLTAIAELISEQHDYKTVVIDSLDWLERFIWDRVCRDFGVANIEKADGGYQRGYTHALTYWRQVVDGLNKLRLEKGMVVLLTAHAKVEKFEDPETTTYDRYAPRLHKHACALITEWCDAVLFATRRYRVETEETGFGRTRTIAVGIGADGGERILRCVGSPACVAKNRFNLPSILPLSWSALVEAMTANKEKKHG